MTFHIGQQVECVDDSAFPYKSEYPDPIKGKHYTVRYVGKLSGESVIALDEIKQPPGFLDVYKASRFRPVRRTDAGMAMLNKIVEHVNAGRSRTYCRQL